jgi:hypothetical protein
MKLLRRLSPVSIFLCICAVYITGFFAHALYLHKTVYGDGIYYYSWLRSAVVDHTINFPDGNKYSIGPAIFWAPAFLLVHQVLRGDGYTLPYQLGTGLTSVLATLFALALLWRMLRKYFSTTVSIMTVAAIAGATNLLFYGSIDTVNSHALSFFTAVIFLTLLLQKQKNWFAMGGALGFLGLMRTQDILYGILLIPYISKKNILLIITGFLLVFSLQLIAWQLLYGKFWVSPYLLHEVFNFTSPHIFDVLFNVQNGLFLWTPITLLGTIGLITKKRFLLLSVFLLELYTVASWSTWSQGASYSGRMFVSTLPILAFGIASIFSWLTRYKWTRAYFLITIVIPLSVINVILMTFFLLHLH